ncbi:SOS response-associated peptidase [Hahella sp. NBU794]|uniref:SOS response-associated peptidase n=1 Tax=Hahella sp. NBU794 TaxID=3422590 RepID=UPI003D6EAB4F
MCGRFNATASAEIVAAMESFGFDATGLRKRWFGDMFNIAPTEAVMVAIQEGGKRYMREMRWWLTPHWASEISNKFSMFNARAETLEKSRAFSGPFKYRRGVIPASGFIEWGTEKGVKQPYYLKPPSGNCYFAALWDVWLKEEHYLETCAIITTEASDSIRWLHDRMPALLSPDQFDAWVDPATPLSEVRAMLVPRDLSDWEIIPVNPSIGAATNKSSDAIQPVNTTASDEKLTQFEQAELF